LPCASLTPAGEERCAVDFIVLLGMLAATFPRAPVIVVICDNDSIHPAVSWPGRLQQIHAFFRSRSPDKMLTTAASRTSPWLPPVTSRTFDNSWNAA